MDDEQAAGEPEVQQQIDDLREQVTTNREEIDALADRADANSRRADASEASADAARRRADASEARAMQDRLRIDELETRSELDRAMILQLHEEGVLSREHVAHLQDALRTSRRIGAAIGIIMAARAVTEDAAFGLLRQASQHSNRKVRDLADELVLSGDTSVIPTS